MDKKEEYVEICGGETLISLDEEETTKKDAGKSNE